MSFINITNIVIHILSKKAVYKGSTKGHYIFVRPGRIGLPSQPWQGRVIAIKPWPQFYYVKRPLNITII
ncbi:MAG: hypothetical protein UT09_C0005G0003 [Parcubacteria group bacterium GW2011_GWF2_38_8]|nr:MAG: hypothetical protein UT09_C0005G0003 [Parcubacteria group bacterium GW2011_GWF2_38_8]